MVTILSPSGREITFAKQAPLVIIAGPCVIESRDLVFEVAERLSHYCATLELPLVFKSSFDKANRTSAKGYRGVGLEEGLKILTEVREAFDCPVITDIHSPEQAMLAAASVDILQIPAFLCRQTDLLEAAGSTGKPVMIKKGQFLHPSDMRYARDKVRNAGGDNVLLCERGVSFGYRELIVDFRSLAEMAELDCPVVFDATHSVQIIGGGTGSSAGKRQFVPLLARAAVAVGVQAVFIETHPSPDTAPSDGPNMIPLDHLFPLLQDLKTLAGVSLATRDR